MTGYGPDFSVSPTNDTRLLLSRFSTLVSSMKVFIAQYGVAVPSSPAQLPAAYEEAKRIKAEQEKKTSRLDPIRLMLQNRKCSTTSAPNSAS